LVFTQMMMMATRHDFFADTTVAAAVAVAVVITENEHSFPFSYTLPFLVPTFPCPDCWSAPWSFFC
jgi:hypothetical protein